MLFPLFTLMNAADLDIRGPILASGKPPLVSRQSVQAAVQPKAISPNDLGPGIGQWIWCPAAKSGEPARFLRSITLTEHPKLARGWITAEARYRMWINGRLAARGPADSGRDYDSGPCGPWLEDVRDLTPYFRKGENIVAVEVFANPLVQYDASTGHPGLKIDFRLQCGSKPVKEYGSDTKWLSAPAADLDQTGAKNGYRLNMVVEPAMWQIGQSIAPNWMPATLSHREKPETLVSELPQSLEAVIKPTGLARVSAGVTPNLSTGGAKFAQSGTYTLQFGHVLSGYIGMTVRGHKGSRIILTPNEHDAPGANRQSEILLRDGIQTFELPYYDSFSVINIKAEDISEPIEIVDVRCVFTSFPVQYTGEFSCSDPEFNRIWEVCRWVTQICMQTHHLDSPHHQEPISDAGDYLIESLNSFYAFGEGTLARQDLKKIARTLEQRQFQSFHTSYSLLWLRMLVQYYEYTGDSAPLKELAPQVEGLMRQFEGYIGKNGLISEAPNYMFMDWVEIDGYNLHHPPAVIGQGYMTALYYQALTDAQVVAKLSSSSGLSSYYEKRRNSIKAAFETELWNSAKGLYRDGKPFQTSVKPNQWMPADRDIETFSTQVNTLAVSCGLVEPSRAKMVMKSILDRSDMNCQPYFMHFVFEALSKSGLMSELADRQLRRWQIVPDTQSFHEMWTVGDLSHAWNATPMFQMSGRVLGVIPIKPGFEEFAVRPITLGLAWAKGKVPTPHGVIEVSWNKTGDQIRLEITVPKGTKARVGGRLVGPGKRQLFIGLADLNL